MIRPRRVTGFEYPVEKKGGLPEYICRVARGIMRSGRSRQTAIQMAIGRMKVWAAGGGNVNADTRAKAAAAVAEWEKMKMTAQKLAEFNTETGDVLLLSATLPSFSLEGVKRAWDAQQKGESGQVTEVWTDAVIVQNTDGSTDRIPFEMLDGAVSFGEPQRVTMVAVPVDLADEVLEALAEGEFEEEFEQNEEFDAEEPDSEEDSGGEEMELSVRRVRTPEGARRYNAPIGSPIVKDPVTGAMKAVVKGLPKGKPVKNRSQTRRFKDLTSSLLGPRDDSSSAEAALWDAQVGDSVYAERNKRVPTLAEVESLRKQMDALTEQYNQSPSRTLAGKGEDAMDAYHKALNAYNTGTEIEFPAPTPAEVEKLRKRAEQITERYNREYAEGKWSTNRRLAGEGEDAWSAYWAAGRQYGEFLKGQKKDYNKRIPGAKQVTLEDLAAVAGADMEAEEKKLAAIVHPESVKKLETAKVERPLYEIADEIQKSWKNPNFAAKPYLDALRYVSSMDDTYFNDDARTIVNYFLSNAASWRGPEAKRIKAELRAMLKRPKKMGLSAPMEFTRRVRTAAGAKFYGAPIGSVIVRDPVTGKLKAVTGASPKAPQKSSGDIEALKNKRTMLADKLAVSDKRMSDSQHAKVRQELEDVEKELAQAVKKPRSAKPKKDLKDLKSPAKRESDVKKRAESYKGEGTPKDPVRVHGDIEAAAYLLSEGKSIRLDSEMEAGTLVDKLAEIVEDAKKRGDKAPDYDLCKVSVPGTNLFCAQNKGIPRAQMPQFKGKTAEGDTKDVEEGWRQMLQDKGIKVTRKQVTASHLKASQMQLDGVKVAGMATALDSPKLPKKSRDALTAPIFVTKDGYVLDGHHRWAALVANDLKDGKLGDVDMSVDIIDIEIGEAIDLANAYTRSQGIVPKGLGKDAEGVKEKAPAPKA